MLGLVLRQPVGERRRSRGRRAPAEKVRLGLGVPLVAAVVWGTFVAPKAPVKVPGVVRLVVEVAVFASATAALYVAGNTCLASSLVLLYVVHRVLLTVLWQRLFG
jgi:hypothetical protein